MPILFNCPSCKHQMKVASKLANEEAQCINCGRFVRVPNPLPLSGHRETAGGVPAGAHVVTNNFKLGACVITDVRIPFWRCVCIIIKWTLAAIPAMIILGLVYFLFSLFVLGGLGAAFFL